MLDCHLPVLIRRGFRQHGEFMAVVFRPSVNIKMLGHHRGDYSDATEMAMLLLAGSNPSPRLFMGFENDNERTTINANDD